MTQKFNYRWTLKDVKFSENKGKVFSCFACGGGSTMGYKLAGFKVIGFNEIDPKMANIYIKNHRPQFQFVEAIQDFVRWEEFPQELYNLDILDGSPPCTPFSIAGNREADWGKEKFFREGQKAQVLDTLFFDFIELARKLQPKIIIAENVKGLLQGKAKIYTQNILNAFETAGYKVNYHLLDASKMGVPQKRERVFFVAIRKDLAEKVSDLHFNFNEKPIPFSEIKTGNQSEFNFTDRVKFIWQNRISTDRKLSDVLERVEGKCSHFNSYFVHNEEIVKTITACDGTKMVLFDTPRRMNLTELKLAQSFPLDFDFGTTAPSSVQYVLGMSVPPVMMANLVSEIYRQWINIFDNE